mgnify:CR=1 FL=1
MRKDSGVETYKYNGKTYHFNGLYGYVYLVQQCNAKGIQVTAQISIDRNASTQSFIRETVLMQKQLIMDGTQITAQLDRLWKQCLHIWERSLEKITVI